MIENLLIFSTIGNAVLYLLWYLERTEHKQLKKNIDYYIDQQYIQAHKEKNQDEKIRKSMGG